MLVKSQQNRIELVPRPGFHGFDVLFGVLAMLLVVVSVECLSSPFELFVADDAVPDEGVAFFLDHPASVHLRVVISDAPVGFEAHVAGETPVGPVLTRVMVRNMLTDVLGVHESLAANGHDWSLIQLYFVDFSLSRTSYGVLVSPLLRNQSGAASAQKALQGLGTETRDLLGGTEENSVSLTRGH